MEAAKERWAKKSGGQPASSDGYAQPAPAAPVKKPPQTEPWKANVEGLLRTTPGQRSRPKVKALLFFSFFLRYNQYVVQPGFIKASAVPEELWHDREALRAYLVENRRNPAILSQVSGLRDYQIDDYEWVNTTPGYRLVIDSALRQLQYSYYSYQQTVDFWGGMADALVFVGTENNPFRESVSVLSGTAPIELEMHREEGGIRLSLVVSFPDHSVKMGSSGLTIFNQNPLWLRIGSQITKVGTDLYKLKSLNNKFDTFIPAESVDNFIQMYFASLANAYNVRGETMAVETLSLSVPHPRVYLMEEGQQLRAALRFAYQGYECYGMKKPPGYSYVRDAERDVIVKVERNQEFESRWWERLSRDEFGLKCGHLRDGTSQDVFLVRARVHPFDFLKNFVPKLAEAGVEVYGEADLKLARINRARPTISFSVTSGIDWFDVKTVINYGDLEVSLAEIRKSLRKHERFIRLVDGSIGEIPDEWLEKYKHLFGLGEASEDGLRLSRHHVTLLDQLLSDNEHVQTDKQFEVARAWLKNFDGIRSRELPSGFIGELRPYQKAGFDWLHFLREARFGGCLADDMGTGKTIQALCFMQSLKEEHAAKYAGKRGRRERKPTHLLVVPRSLIFNWEREAQRFTPDLKVLNFAHAERASDLKEFDKYDIVLTTYGVMLREIERLMEYEFDTVILDEAQAIKNPVSESAKAARLLRGRNKLTLTGTPVENNTLELWSQFAFLNPGLLGSIDYFREGFSGPIERQGDEQATQTLRRMVYPFILRRTKDQVSLDLPPRSEKILWEEMEPEQRRIYNLTRDEYRAKILQLIDDKGLKDARFRILEGLLRLRQICNHPILVDPKYHGSSAKLEALMEAIETLNAEGHKALVFSQFVRMLRLIERQINKAKIPYSYLDGSTLNRQARVDAFQNDEQTRIFLISLKAGGVGLNLTAADYVIHVDPWWNPAVEMQATDRAHRIGQDKPVFVYKLMMKDSVEEKILQLQERKRNLVRQLISTEAGFFKSLTASDISELFS